MILCVFSPGVIKERKVNVVRVKTASKALRAVTLFSFHFLQRANISCVSPSSESKEELGRKCIPRMFQEDPRLPLWIREKFRECFRFQTEVEYKQFTFSSWKVSSPSRTHPLFYSSAGKSLSNPLILGSPMILISSPLYLRFKEVSQKLLSNHKRHFQ